MIEVKLEVSPAAVEDALRLTAIATHYEDDDEGEGDGSQAGKVTALWIDCFDDSLLDAADSESADALVAADALFRWWYAEEESMAAAIIITGAKVEPSHRGARASYDMVRFLLRAFGRGGSDTHVVLIAAPMAGEDGPGPDGLLRHWHAFGFREIARSREGHAILHHACNYIWPDGSWMAGKDDA